MQGGRASSSASVDIDESDESDDSGFHKRTVMVGDVVITDASNDTDVSNDTALSSDSLVSSPVFMHPAFMRLAFILLVRRGAWRFARPGEPGDTVTTWAGSFVVCPDGPPPLLEARPGAEATVLLLPSSALGPLLPGRGFVGSARSAEACLLTAYASTLCETSGGLSPAGERAARDALVHLVRAVLSQEAVDHEEAVDAAPVPSPGPALALARAAMEMVDSRLADPDLSPASLAGELNVSLRTLHRAFAAAGEPVAAYIRRCRLERARTELTAVPRRPDIADLAAHWQFADSSHFIRAFRKQYGETPARLARVGGTVRS